MQRAVRAFVPGDGPDDALAAAIDLRVLGIGTLYLELAAPVTDAAGATATVVRHLDLLARLADAESVGEITISPVALGLDVDEDACFGHLRTLAATAEATGSCLWLDMDGSRSVDRTLELYQRLRASHARTGICLQASLRRTAKDVERLLPMAPAIRLVKSAYIEPRAAAFATRKEVDANYLALAVTLLRESRTRPGMRVCMATHDAALIDQVTTHAAAAGITKDGFEIGMLFGVQAREQRRLARSGYRVQTQIPYGADWYGWYMRRLAEHPANLLHVLRQALPG